MNWFDNICIDSLFVLAQEIMKIFSCNLQIDALKWSTYKTIRNEHKEYRDLTEVEHKKHQVLVPDEQINHKDLTENEHKIHQDPIPNKQKVDQYLTQSEQKILQNLKIKDLISSSPSMSVKSLKKLLKKVERFTNFIKSAITIKKQRHSHPHSHIRVH